MVPARRAAGGGGGRRGLLPLLLLAAVALPTDGAGQVAVRLCVRHDLGVALSNVPQVPPADWQDGFQPPGGTMRTHVRDYALFWDLGATLEPAVRLGSRTAIGFPLSFGLTLAGQGNRGLLTFKKTVAMTKVDWWNRVSLLEVKLTTTYPGLGVSLRRGRSRVEVAARPYRLSIQDFRGVDRSGDRNLARVVRERAVATGVAYRVAFSRLGAGGHGDVQRGVYCELAGHGEERVVLCGLSFQASLARAREAFPLPPVF